MASRVFSLTLVRHGQTTHNKLKIIQGQMETELTELGREQARSLRTYLDETKETFDKVYSSDLIRAFETCQILCNGRNEIIKNVSLRERSFGVLQGSHLDMLRTEAYKAGYDESNFTKFRPEGGETMEEVRDRILKFCRDELFPKARESESILIVTHGGVIREFMKIFKTLGCHLEHKDLIITPNTSLNRFKIRLNSENQANEVVITALHSIPHLKSEAKSEALSEEQLNDSTMKKKEVEYAI